MMVCVVCVLSVYLGAVLVEKQVRLSLTSSCHHIPTQHHSEHMLACTVATPTCGQSCDKLLSCGVHRCTRVCHHGNCGQCVQVRDISCRCGRRNKTLVCSTSWVCDYKCQKMRACQSHVCKRKVTRFYIHSRTSEDRTFGNATSVHFSSRRVDRTLKCSVLLQKQKQCPL